LLARQTDGAAVQLPPKQAVIPALWCANKKFKNLILYRANTSKFRHCEEGVLPDEAISNIVSEIASGEYALAMTGCTVEKNLKNLSEFC